MIIALQTLIFFRESLFTVLEHFLKPYYQRLTLTFKDEENSDDDDDDHVCAEYDDEKGVVFYPPVYAQRYAAVTDCLMDERWNGMLEKVIDFGYHDMSFIKYLKDVPGVKNILGVDLETAPLRCSSDLFKNSDSYVPRTESQLQITLFQGNAADPDYRLIGADGVVAIEMIEHMLPHDLERFVHTVFGFIKPRVAIITTPNGDFNVLFKSLEKNGLRRLDHFFEWSREQFSDWCSNVVARYPQYTVTCKGIGPGPADTLHLGCCSQLALFVADDYHKQPDLSLNSLALVAKQPSPANVISLEGWESPETIDNNLLCIENSDESYTEFLPKQQSYMTIILTSPTFSLETLEYADKMLQCNLEIEIGKNFLMFDDEVYYNTVVPRRKRVNRVYVIEDVASRLNCSMVQVTKFSKVTQNLLAKNKMDSFAYTREVVDEIKNLTEMLNLNKNQRDNELQNGNIWCNINWGENAPYWNQYYKMIREYSYPFQQKSDDCRILDAISEEISRLIDLECDEFSVNTDKLEIPMDHLMSTVEYITNDVDKVKDILEWNGYEIVDNALIHPRLVLEKKSDLSEDWQEADTLSDWDTNAILSISSGNTNLLDLNGRLRRALEQKIHRLRSLTNENVIPDLDHIVCRLMKLALYTSKGQHNPPSTIWMQNKLFDLLSLTEKAIERRRRYFLENFTFKAIEYKKDNNNEEINKNQQKTEDISEEIMSKYQHLIEPSDNIDETLEFLDDQLQETELDDSITSNEFKDYEYHETVISNVNDIEDSSLRIKPYDTQFNNLEMLENSGSFIYMDCNTSIKVDNKYNSNDESVHTLELDKEIIGTKINLTSKTKLTMKTKLINNYDKYDIVPKISKPRHKKISSKGSKFKLIKNQSVVSIENKRKRKKKLKEHQKLQSKLSKPIPDSLINICDLENGNKMELPNNITLQNNADATNDNTTHTTSIVITEKSLFLAIVTESGEETIALRRHVGTDPDVILDIDKDIGSETVINITSDSFHHKPYANLENVQSDTIFLNDINEPSTSKGIRNLSTDVQCGPDTSLNYTLSPTISYKKITNIYNYGIKIEDSCTRVPTIKKTCDFGMCTENDEKPIEVSTNVDIKIKDSNLCNTNDLLTLKPLEDQSTNKVMTVETTLLKSKIEDSDSEFCGSLGSLQKLHITNSSKNTSESQIQCVNDNNVLPSSPQSKRVTQKLVCGGVHVHSFKEKLMVSEDVVYQGEWQRTPKVIAKKISSEFTYKKRALIQKRKQQSLKDNSLVKNLGKDETRKFTKRTMLTKCKRENNTNKELKNEAEQQKTKNIQKSPNYMRTSRNVEKVLSKVTLRLNMISDKTRSLKNFNSKKTTNYIARSEVETRANKEIKKNYLPLYLRRRLKISVENKESLYKLKSSITNDDENKNIIQPPNSDIISKDLLKLSENMLNNISYVVFRNDIENEQQLMPSTEENNNNLKRSISPQSQNSSTCSSPNSVATVRAMKIARNRIICNQKDSISERSSSGMESDNISSKYKHPKRCKIYKKSPAVCSNKENVPQSSKNLTSNDVKNISKTAKNMFVGKTKSVFMVHANENSNVQSTSTKFSKSASKPVKCLDSKINSLKKDMKIADRSILKKNSLDNNVQHNPDKNASFHIMDEDDSVVFNSFKDLSFTDISNTSNEIQLQALESSVKSIHNTKSSIMSTIRRLLEDKIKIGDDNSQESPISDSETVILNKYELDNSINSSVSLSINTLLSNEESENEGNNSFNSATKMMDQDPSLLSFAGIKTPIKESDSFSFKSIESIPISKFSEYYLADNELGNTFTPQKDNLNANLVQDIFDRNNKNSNFPGVLGVSEFSVNAEPFPGDHVNLIDSETGSLAPNSARLTASEELFVSGRSSDTYESCFFDDDTYVPNWLFDVLSQQQSIEESEASEEPIEVSLFDVNNNTIEPGVGVISGAGDGRGIHSDHSQDSSGRGTSLSSTASSGPENEAILFIDLTAERAHVPTVNVPSDVLNISERNESTRHSINPEQNASDVDADVSSMDTDVLDSDI